MSDVAPHITQESCVHAIGILVAVALRDGINGTQCRPVPSERVRCGTTSAGEHTITYTFTLGDRFAMIAQQNPDRHALRLPDGRSVTYQALLQQALGLRRKLAGRGLSQERPLAILHGKTLEGYAAMLAALSSGIPYCNLDERNPPERQRLVLETLQPGMVLTTGVDDSAVAAITEAIGQAGIDCPIVNLERDRLIPEGTGAESAGPIGTDIAYVMFTSGSTGRPKGVAISHASVLNFVDWTRDVFAITHDDVVSNLNPMHFDNSVFDFYASLFNGACLAPVARGDLDRPPTVVRTLEAAKCTVLFAVPSLLIYLQSMRALTADRLQSLRLVSFGGEGYAKPELRRLFDAFGARARLVNVYGPTECTCICSSYDVTEADFEDMDTLAPLGPMAANFRGLVLDGETAVADGEVGELCLAGPNVGLGYYRDPLRTADVFVDNPLQRAFRERIYRTGDFVRRDRETGIFHFVGRRDQQIKHMGHRIELGEVESALNAIDGVRQSAVLYKRGPGPFGRIVAVVSAGDRALDEASLLDAARARLPQYMVPHRIEVREDLPRNPNGKIDRRRLAEELE